MTEAEIVSKYTNKYEKTLSVVVKRAIRRLKQMLTDFQAEGGRLLVSEDNLRFAAEMTEKMFTTLKEAGYNKVAEAYRTDFTKILTEVNKAGVLSLSWKFLPKDKSFLIALRDMQYAGMFRVESEVANTIQRLTTDYVLTERPLDQLIAELTKKLDGNLQRYAKTHIETATRYALQKAEDITIDNLGIPEEDRYWRYIGPEDDKTRQECLEALEIDVFTNVQRQEFEEQYGIRYNCRHRFYYINEEDYKKRATYQGSLYGG